ncbi:fructosamine kinase family protein [Maribellus maritimus]|uniref:fructosamine kinase family protein n=1 Tax=Maribellus maritimus TaxID=2870838 RepID=UPI001EEB125A|nr:fructosamine kinase family protein [Maribellus maritimus]MCG6187749.1 fructosamine kinase family protein [Maribellus maritimus]
MSLFQNKSLRIEEEVEKALSKKFEKNVKIQSSGSLGGGCINHASKIKTNVGEFFLKWNANCAADIFLREAESLKELNKVANEEILVPEVFASKMVDNTPGFLVQEFLPPRYSKAGDDEKLGAGLAVIHKYTNKNNGFYNDNYCGATQQNNRWNKNWAEFFRDNRLGFLLELIQDERPLPASEMQAYEKLLTRIPALVPEESTPVLIHGDLWSGNYMITEKGPALIDPAAYYADREMEFAIMTMFGGFSQRFYDAYNSVNPLFSDWRDRNQLYQLYHVLNHYYLFGGGYQSQAYQIARYYI